MGERIARIMAAVMNQAWMLRSDVQADVAEVIARTAQIEPGDQKTLAAARLVLAGGALGRPLNCGGRFDDRAEPAAEPDYQVRSGIAVIDIWGVLDKTDADVGMPYFRYGTSYETIRRAFGKAQSDSAVSGIIMRIDSPGGAAMPVGPVASMIRSVAQGGIPESGKPTWAYSDDMAASAAYYLASQVTRGGLYTSPGGWLGSIGTIIMHADYSKMLAEYGITMTAIKSTEAKDTGSPYRPLTAEDKARLQAEVDEYDRQFVEAVAIGRHVSTETVKGWQKQRGFIGAKAVEAGLADGVADSIDEVIAAMAAKFGTSSMVGGKRAVLSAAKQTAGDVAVSNSKEQGMFWNKVTMKWEPKEPSAGEVAAGAGAAAPVATPPKPDPAAQAAVLAHERARVAAIDERAAPFAADAAVVELATKAKAEGMSVDAFAGQVLAHLGNSKKPVGRSPDVQLGTEQRTKFSALATAAMLGVLAGGSVSLIRDEQDDNKANRVAGRLGFADRHAAVKAFDAVRSEGLGRMRVETLMQMCIAQSLGTTLDSVIRSHGEQQKFWNAAFHTSSDFPKILENAAQKTAMAAYEEADVIWTKIARKGTHNDYKTRKIVGLSEAQNFKKLAENGRPTEVTFNEKGEAVDIDPFGVAISFTYQMVRNDDLGLFSQVLAMQGAAARRIPEDLIIALLTANSGMGPTLVTDNTTLFHANHKNTFGPTALSYGEAWKAIILMQKQTGFGKDAAPLNIKPRTLLVPTDLMQTAADICGQDYQPGTGGQQLQRNTVKGRLMDVSTPRLTGTRWWIFGDPQQSPAFEVSFLDGQETPSVTEVPDSGSLAKRFEVIVPGVGASAVQHEAAVTNAGA